MVELCFRTAAELLVVASSIAKYQGKEKVDLPAAACQVDRDLHFLEHRVDPTYRSSRTAVAGL